MEGLPGFTVHAVKKEPWLPVNKTTEKQTPSRLTSGASPLAKCATADEMKITSDEVQSCPHTPPPPYFLTKMLCLEQHLGLATVHLHHVKIYVKQGT
jgi:hypothetical protein